MKKCSVVDLFAGAGGLSLGFEQTGSFEIKVAFENNPAMQKTYQRNHPNVDVYGDVCAANYSEIKNKYGKIDVVIGGPPCQGFSNANRQKNHAISKNNMLVKQFIRAIIELQPKAFIMENVSMLKSSTHRFYMEEGDKEMVEKYDIPIKESVFHLLDEKFSFDGILNIIDNIQQIEQHLWSEGDYSELNIIYKSIRNPYKLKKTLKKHQHVLERIARNHMQIAVSPRDEITQINHVAFTGICDFYTNTVDISTIKDMIEPAIMLQRMLRKAKEIKENHLVVKTISDESGVDVFVYSYAVYDYLKAVLGSTRNEYAISSGVLCATHFGAPQKRNRFIMMGVKKSISLEIALPTGDFSELGYRTVYDAIADLEEIEPVFDLVEDQGIHLPDVILQGLGAYLRDTQILHNHIVTRTTDTALARFRALKQGQNFHSLKEELKIDTYTDASRTQNTIYLRLDYAVPCGTVVNVRKSMWIHPTKDRALSIREAARLQTFPDSFIFCGTKDKQYQQVGNAVPPIMAKAVATQLARYLKV